MLGRVVVSKSGRDKGRMFVIVQSINANYVAVADGDLRKIEKPKQKNLKHLQLTNTRLMEIKTSLLRGEMPENHIIRKSIKKLQGSGEIDGKEVW